jgi:hypothetical protein
MGIKARSSKRNTKARSASNTKARSASNTKARSANKSTKGSIKARDSGAKKEARGSGVLKGGTQLGIEKGDKTVGRIKIGGEAGLESDYSAGDFKEGAEDVFDSIKSGVKTAKKKISDNL